MDIDGIFLKDSHPLKLVERIEREIVDTVDIVAMYQSDDFDHFDS